MAIPNANDHYQKMCYIVISRYEMTYMRLWSYHAVVAVSYISYRNKSM